MSSPLLSTLSLHDALPILVADLLDDDRDGGVADALRGADAVFHLAGRAGVRDATPDRERLRHRDNVLAAERVLGTVPDRKSTRLNSSHLGISYAVFCLKKK